MIRVIQFLTIFSILLQSSSFQILHCITTSLGKETKIHPADILFPVADSTRVDSIIPSLNDVLSKCAHYCDKLTRAALNYTCEESVKEEIYHYIKYIDVVKNQFYFSNDYHRIERNSYIFNYQLVTKQGIIQEKRIPIQRQSNRSAPVRFLAEKPIFAPVGLLGSYWQKYYEYRIIKVDQLWGRKSLVIEAKPLRKLEANPNYGKVWIDIDDFAILKIEFNQESLANYQFYLQEASNFGAIPEITVATLYETEKKGIRFPSRTTFQESYVGGDLKRRLRKSNLTIDYGNYKFFVVDYDVTIKKNGL